MRKNKRSYAQLSLWCTLLLACHSLLNFPVRAYAQSAISAATDVSPVINSDEARSKLRDAAKLYTLKQYKEAEPILLQSLELANQGGNTSLQSTIKNDLGLVLLKQGRKDEALQQFDQATKLIGDSGSVSIRIAILTNRGLSKLSSENLKEAKANLCAADELVRTTDQREEAIEILNILLTLYIHQHDYPSAKKVEIRLIPLLQGQGREELAARNFLNLADTADALHDFHGAESYYKQALAMKEKLVGPSSLNLFNVIRSTAVFYDKNGKTAQAEALYKRLVELAHKNPNASEVHASLLNLAVFYHQKKRYAEAAKLYVELAEYLTRSTKDQNVLSQSLLTIANDLRDERNFKLAQPLYDRAVSMKRKRYAVEKEAPNGIAAFDLAWGLRDYAEFLAVQGKNSQSIAIRNESRRIINERTDYSRATGTELFDVNEFRIIDDAVQRRHKGIFLQ
jgi:tetratricopeptide (TPR) repeat protein